LFDFFCLKKLKHSRDKKVGRLNVETALIGVVELPEICGGVERKKKRQS
jgi:hypothetical protein